MKDASGAVVALDNADGATSGTLSLVDPDGGTAGTLAGFSSKAVAGALSGDATVVKGTYGTFEIVLPVAGDAPAAEAAWKYTLNEFDKDTRALVYGAKAIDKVNVTATDGSVYTISVNVTGANNAPEFMRTMDAVTGLPTETSIAPKVNKDGTITYQVIDGDTGGKLTLQVKDGELVRDVTALTVVDGGVSTVKLATANSTVLYTGIMQVTDKTHAALDLGTYLGMGTKGNDTFNSESAVGSLISGMDGNDTVNVTGDGAAYISGGAGNDSVTSAGGNDTILGGVGNDVILAGAGDDRIQGDAGSDVLSGEDGNDTFVFLTSTEFTAASALATAAKADVVMDFADGDKILLSKALLPTAFFTYKDVYLADGTTLGKDGALDLVAAKAFKDNGTGDQVRLNDLIDGEWFRTGDVEISETTGKVTVGTLYAEDRVIYDSNTGVLWYDADGNGTKAAVKIADLDNSYALTANDIQFG
jgi:VCBS repeat-containing protein